MAAIVTVRVLSDPSEGNVAFDVDFDSDDGVFTLQHLAVAAAVLLHRACQESPDGYEHTLETIGEMAMSIGKMEDTE